ncbi:unnamed protein product [Ceratitis capitata]|uniref:(Mediterranean fruit fly) hypothetical protein n=1 Tax=Ceratitis capitata TaxID=7213 RepID=A0A811UZY7_CERCA|nr:unnamed protein product [Ceratitis capitata]
MTMYSETSSPTPSTPSSPPPYMGSESESNLSKIACVTDPAESLRLRLILIVQNGEQREGKEVVGYTTLGFQALSAANAMCTYAPIFKELQFISPLPNVAYKASALHGSHMRQVCRRSLGFLADRDIE